MATSPINGPSGSSGIVGTEQVQGVAATTRAPAAAAQDMGAADDAVNVDVLPSAPPPEVLDAIAAANSAGEQLAARGLRVSFGADTGGKLQVQLKDADGTTLSTLKPSDVLAIAEGADPTETGTSPDE